MAQARIHEARKAGDRIRSRRPTFGKHQARLLVFGLGPAGLKSAIGIEDEDLPPDEDDGTELEADDPDERPRDADADDDDDSQPEWLLDRYAASLGERFAFARSPCLNLRDTYRLVITHRADGGWQCRFDPPAWFTSPSMDAAVKTYVERLSLFLRATAAWLEEEKQHYLSEPAPERFVAEDFSEKEPIIHKDGFLPRIERRMPKHHPIDSSDFTRGFARHVWLLWPDSSMPLVELFSRTYRVAWMLGALRQYHETLPEQAPSITREHLQRARRKRPENRTLDEHWGVLRSIVEIKSEQVLPRLRQAVGED